MRTFNYEAETSKLLTPEIVSMLTKIHEQKGKCENNPQVKPEVLDNLVEIAKIQSTTASNKIENIITTDSRIKKLVSDKVMPKNRNEQEILGYKNVLSLIHENYLSIPLNPNFILQLHRDLLKFTTIGGGKYKNSDNIIAEVDKFGNKTIRFMPAKTWETEPYIDAICKEYNAVKNNYTVDNLLAIPMFILDFLCVHPFDDGNGRMSRLLTLLLLYKEGYMVGKYISIEHIIEQEKELYYSSLQQSSSGWHEGKNNYEPFVKYILSVIIAAYRDFDNRIALALNSNFKYDRVREIIKQSIAPITKAEILKAMPDSSEITVQRELASLVKQGTIIKLGGGRYTKYIWNSEK